MPSDLRKNPAEISMLDGLRRFLGWAAFPGTMAVAFSLYFTLDRLGAPMWFGPYLAGLVAAAIVTVLEIAIPYDRSWFPQWSDVKNDLAFMVAVQMFLPQGLAWLSSMTLLEYLNSFDLQVTQLWPHGLSPVFQLALMLVVAELFRYWLHVAAHTTGLWRLHAVHHSPKKLYWLNVGRFHPLEKAVQYILDVLPFIVMGVGVEVLALYFLFYSVNGFYQHSNVEARYGVLNYVVSGPELHRWHHSRTVEESNNNYGNNLIVWDLVFGSWFLPSDRRVGELGLINRDYPVGFLPQMMTPFVSGLDKQQGAADAP